MLGSQSLLQQTGVDVQAALDDLLREQRLARCAFAWRFGHGLLNVLREFLESLRLQFFPVGRLDFCDLVAKRFYRGIDFSDLFGVGVRFLFRYQRVGGLDISEDRRLQGVIVFLRNRIKFVIVATRTLNCQPQHAAPDRGKHIVEVIKAALRSILFPEIHSRARAKEPRGNHRVDTLRFEFIAGDLLFYENVEGFVLVQRADHVVAIHPGIRTVVVVLKAIGICITRHVQPVPAPAFAIVG